MIFAPRFMDPDEIRRQLAKPDGHLEFAPGQIIAELAAKASRLAEKVMWERAMLLQALRNIEAAEDLQQAIEIAADIRVTIEGGDDGDDHAN